MLAILHCNVFRLPVCYGKYEGKNTQNYKSLHSFMGVKLGLSQ